MEITPEIKDRLEKLQEKYAAMGQDMLSYLDGLLYSNSLTYWDYVHLDTLLSLQTPRTDFPDEKIFIIYHQITELYFRLIRHELNQLQEGNTQDLRVWFLHVGRAVNYFKNLTQSFDVMVEGMDPRQFLKFRMSLLPASGFQSAQFRQIEFLATPMSHLIKDEAKDKVGPDSPLADQYEHIYWKYGNIELKSGRKTLTLRMFEERYDDELLEYAADNADKNVYKLYSALPEEAKQNEELIAMLKQFDLYANVFWRLSHYKSAVRYLQRDPDVIEATGGTNWQKYLPPRFQRVVYFPSIWTEQEIEEWGKAWVMSLFEDKVETSWGKIRNNH